VLWERKELEMAILRINGIQELIKDVIN